ncbi:MAG: hypothetical protein CW691_01630 [Candidatus Bathyarchaeum sp.]|nr:MAG: hypothetical protein CW691_01630 [Candidatus Bathyarchaeum sp.]
MQKYLNKIAKTRNGAKFYKVDLHFHSPSSSDQKFLNEDNNPDVFPKTRADLIKKYENEHDFKATVERVADKIVDRFNEEHLNLVVVTDHNTPSFIDNDDWDKGNWYTEIKEAIKRAEGSKKIEKGKIKVLPGVEITTARVHILAIFNDLDEKDKDDSLATYHISNLLSEIGFKANQVGEFISETGGRSVYHAIKLIVEYGGIPVIAHIDGTGRSFSQSEFKHKPKPASEGGEQAVKFEYKGELEAIISIPELAVMEYVNKSSKLVEKLTWMKALKDLRKKIKIKETKGVKPDLGFVRNSDAHNFEDIAQRYSYVKMDNLNYKSFFYAFREPKNRVMSDQEGKPTEPEYQIDGMAIVGDFLDSAFHRFNPRVNCMVGAVSSGKTTRILDLGEATKDLTGTKETFEKAKGDTIYVTLRTKDGDNQSLWALEKDVKNNETKYWKLKDNYKILEELQGKPKELKDFNPDFILGSKIDKETKAKEDYSTPLAKQCWLAIEKMLDPAKKSPLIIDEMEQCLTDELIEKNLVPALEKCRKNRQIIIASCKSNIPVVLDAENIIIVNKAKTVAAGSIEHKKVLPTMVEITEGGKTTFQEKLRRCGHLYECSP